MPSAPKNAQQGRLPRPRVPNVITKIEQCEYSTRRVDFKTADGRVLFAVSVTEDGSGLEVRTVDPRVGDVLCVFPNATNAVTLKAEQP